MTKPKRKRTWKKKVAAPYRICAECSELYTPDNSRFHKATCSPECATRQNDHENFLNAVRGTSQPNKYKPRKIRQSGAGLAWTRNWGQKTVSSRNSKRDE